VYLLLFLILLFNILLFWLLVLRFFGCFSILNLFFEYAGVLYGIIFIIIDIFRFLIVKIEFWGFNN